MTQLKTDQTQMAKDLVELRAEVDKFITLGDLKQASDAHTCWLLGVSLPAPLGFSCHLVDPCAPADTQPLLLLSACLP